MDKLEEAISKFNLELWELGYHLDAIELKEPVIDGSRTISGMSGVKIRRTVNAQDSNISKGESTNIKQNEDGTISPVDPTKPAVYRVYTDLD